MEITKFSQTNIKRGKFLLAGHFRVLVIHQTRGFPAISKHAHQNLKGNRRQKRQGTLWKSSSSSRFVLVFSDLIERQQWGIWSDGAWPTPSTWSRSARFTKTVSWSTMPLPTRYRTTIVHRISLSLLNSILLVLYLYGLSKNYYYYFFLYYKKLKLRYGRFCVSNTCVWLPGNWICTQLMLYDDSEKLLECRLLKKDEVVSCGETLTFNSHLIDVDFLEGDHKPPSASTSLGRDSKIVEKNKSRPTLSPSQKIIRGFCSRTLTRIAIIE